VCVTKQVPKSLYGREHYSRIRISIIYVRELVASLWSNRLHIDLRGKLNLRSPFFSDANSDPQAPTNCLQINCEVCLWKDSLHLMLVFTVSGRYSQTINLF
jgi:hypothetical protein